MLQHFGQTRHSGEVRRTRLEKHKPCDLPAISRSQGQRSKVRCRQNCLQGNHRTYPNKLFQFTISTFYRATVCNATRGIAVAILSVCLSDVCIVTKWNNRLSISEHHTKQRYLQSFHSNGGCWELSPSTRNIRRK